MLAAFRWNLRLLSYIALVVGAFLIYNTISISVVRRRAEIGIVRALGASRTQVGLAFLGEAAGIGLAGALLGLAAGKASGQRRGEVDGVDRGHAVCEQPARERLRSVVLRFCSRWLSAWACLWRRRWARHERRCRFHRWMPWRRGRREYASRMNKGRDLGIAVVLAIAAAALSQLPAVGGKPVFGYLATIAADRCGGVRDSGAGEFCVSGEHGTAAKASRCGSVVGFAQSGGIARTHVCAGRCAGNGGGHDDFSRNHGGKFSANCGELDGSSVAGGFVFATCGRTGGRPTSDDVAGIDGANREIAGCGSGGPSACV